MDFILDADLGVSPSVFVGNECVRLCIVGRDGCRNTVTFGNHIKLVERLLKGLYSVLSGLRKTITSRH